MVEFPNPLGASPGNWDGEDLIMDEAHFMTRAGGTGGYVGSSNILKVKFLTIRCLEEMLQNINFSLDIEPVDSM